MFRFIRGVLFYVVLPAALLGMAYQSGARSGRTGDSGSVRSADEFRVITNPVSSDPALPGVVAAKSLSPPAAVSEPSVLLGKPSQNPADFHVTKMGSSVGPSFSSAQPVSLAPPGVPSSPMSSAVPEASENGVMSAADFMKRRTTDRSAEVKVQDGSGARAVNVQPPKSLTLAPPTPSSSAAVRSVYDRDGRGPLPETLQPLPQIPASSVPVSAPASASTVMQTKVVDCDCGK